MLDKERDLLFAVLEASKSVKKIEDEINKFTPSLTEANQVKEKAEIALMEYMDDTGKERFRSSDFNVDVTKRETLHARFVKERKEDAIDFIEEDCGRSDAIKRDPQIHHKTLTSIIQARIKNAEPVPAELFSMYYQKDLIIKEVKK